MKVSPCKGCEKRQLYCHSCCNDYEEWRRHVEMFRKGERKEFLVYSTRSEAVYKFKKEHAGEHVK